jgi:hypothetical protein
MTRMRSTDGLDSFKIKEIMGKEEREREEM